MGIRSTLTKEQKCLYDEIVKYTNWRFKEYKGQPYPKIDFINKMPLLDAAIDFERCQTYLQNDKPKPRKKRDRMSFRLEHYRCSPYGEFIDEFENSTPDEQAKLIADMLQDALDEIEEDELKESAHNAPPKLTLEEFVAKTEKERQEQARAAVQQMLGEDEEDGEEPLEELEDDLETETFLEELKEENDGADEAELEFLEELEDDLETEMALESESESELGSEPEPEMDLEQEDEDMNVEAEIRAAEMVAEAENEEKEATGRLEANRDNKNSTGRSLPLEELLREIQAFQARL